MSKVYDSWDRLVGAVLKREDLRRLALSQSLSSSISADFSFEEDAPSAGSSSKNNIIYNDVEPIHYAEIKKATQKYRPIEQGGIGVAFKGWLDELTLTAARHGSGMPVAVKWTHCGPQEHQEWLEGMSHLPGARVKVATDAARGLSLLHDNEVRPLVHGNVKSANILLDGDINAKFTNFGLARDGPTGVSTPVMDTCKYAAPEYVATGRLTAKCDVYGFGVVLLELLSGRRAYETNRVREQWDLVDWAKTNLGSKRKVMRLMDTTLEGRYSVDAAYKVAKLASQCLSLDPKFRPWMAEVVIALQKVV